MPTVPFHTTAIQQPQASSIINMEKIQAIGDMVIKTVPGEDGLPKGHHMREQSITSYRTVNRGQPIIK